MAATKDATERLERQKATESQRRERELGEARALASRLEKAQVTVKVRVGKDGKLFGSVTNADVASALKQQHDIALDRRKIEFPDPIRGMGQSSFQVRLHPDVVAKIPLMVTSG